MSGLIGAINTALSGLEAFETGINTVSENLSNQSTPGYSVESVHITTSQIVSGEAGNGVLPAQVARAGDGFAAGLLRTANSAGAAASVQSAALANLSSTLQNNGDVQSAINQFFQDVSSLAANPTSSGAQQTVLSDAETVAGTFQSAAGAITVAQTGVNTALQQSVSTANNLLGQLGVINKGLLQAPNNPALLDQQEATLNSLSQQLPITVLPQPDGQVLVTTAGAVLLDQAGAQNLKLTPGTATTPPVVTVGSAPEPMSLAASDGALGANLQAYQAGAQALQGLGALAAIFSASVNTAQAEGLTPSGAQGGALFSVPAPSVATVSNPDALALNAAITTPSQLPTDGGPFQLSYTTTAGVTTWTATDQTTGTAYPVTVGANTNVPPQTTLAFAGMTATITGLNSPSTSGAFVINPAPSAAAGIQVTTTNPDDVAAADPFVASPGTLQPNGAIADNNAGTTVFGTDTVIGAAAAATAQAAGAAVVPASVWTAANPYPTPMQLVFTSPTQYSVETIAGAPVLDAAGNPVTGTFSANGGGSIAIAYPSASAAAGQFWQLPLSGNPATGDVITLQPGGSGSGSNASRMAGLWTQPAGTTAGTLQQAVIGFGTTLGGNAQQAQQLATATASQVTSATTNLQTISGVSTDQQAVVLTNYQQAYQAAAQVISTAHQMFESLLQAV